ncbi:hypothetical protein Tco_0424344 [Tanacetum coccineum]
MSTQQDINAFRAQRIANTHDPLALMANTQTPCHRSLFTSLPTYKFHKPNNNFILTTFIQTRTNLPTSMPNQEISQIPRLHLNGTCTQAKAFTLNDTTPTLTTKKFINPSRMQNCNKTGACEETGESECELQFRRIICSTASLSYSVLSLTKLPSMTQTDQLRYTIKNCYDNAIFNMFTQEEQYS